ncbi:clarin-3-like isoform X1 [Haliotis rufescens]|uniref:clarin-3-like isoform X1 n=1 Tax=Haliotis rufescens TaxID=6454 RepID=UPI001EB03DD4|nr:clarin-3-like isoform X1 [Haliotis rufescens]
MEPKKKNAMAVTLVLGILGVSLLIASFATDNWVTSSPVLKRSTQTPGNDTDGSATKYTGNITFGLFRGHRVLDYGIGPRPQDINVVCSGSDGVCAWSNSSDSAKRADYIKRVVKFVNINKTNGTVKDLIEYGLFNFGLWVSTIVMLALGIVWGLVSLGFTAFNVVGKPIETITGPAGLYLWNGLACTFSLLGALLFVGLFTKDLSSNVLPKDDVEVGWVSKDRTSLDYSFYFVVGAVLSFIASNVILLVSGQKLSCSYKRAGEKELDNGMILY